MTGGVFGKEIGVGNDASFVVTLTPTKGVRGANIVIFLQKKETSGYKSVKDASVNSVSGGTKGFHNNPAGTYRIYLRNYTGLEMKGKSYIAWRW